MLGGGDLSFGLKSLTEGGLEEPPERLTGRDRRRTLGEREHGYPMTLHKLQQGQLEPMKGTTAILYFLIKETLAVNLG